MISVRRCLPFYLLVAVFGALMFGPALAGAQAGSRKLVLRTAPVYPELARSMALQGVVKVEAVVAPDGSVKDVAVKGGHPVLAQAAVNTVRRWKWEPTAHESREVVEVKFSPE